MENNELYHWGIKGMKWGRRRYQNKDGSLTPEGKKRYGDDDSESSSDQNIPKPKTSKEMSNEELSDAIRNLELQKRYNQLYNEMNPQTVSKGKQIIEDLIFKSVLPAIQEGGKQALKEAIVNAGKNAFKEEQVESAYDKLKKKADIVDLEAKISENLKKKRLADDFLDQRDKDLADRNKKNEEQAKKDAQAKRDSKKAEKEQNRESRTKTTHYSYDGKKDTDPDDNKPYEGTVEGKGKSAYNDNKNKYDTTFDYDWVSETLPAVVPASTKSTGERIVNDFLLELKKD